jgi:hypothetical protein
MWPSLIALVISSIVAIILLWVRGSFKSTTYCIVSLSLVAAACALIAYPGDIVLSISVYHSPNGLTGGVAMTGISAWSIPGGILSEVAICTFPPRRYWRILQGVTAVFLAVVWLLAGLWVT